MWVVLMMVGVDIFKPFISELDALSESKTKAKLIG